MGVDELEALDLNASGVVLEGVRFEHCEGPLGGVFMGCAVADPVMGRVTPSGRSVVRNVEVVRCRFGLDARGAVLDEVRVDGLIGVGLSLYGCAFRHVDLRGRIRDLHIEHAVHHEVEEDPEYWQQYFDANEEFHAGVDWALDISAGRFVNCKFRGLPIDKIRLDPSCQAVATPEQLMAARESFDDSELVGIVGSSIRRAHEQADPASYKYWDVVTQPEGNSKTWDAECELIQELYRRGFVAVPTC